MDVRLARVRPPQVFFLFCLGVERPSRRVIACVLGLSLFTAVASAGEVPSPRGAPRPRPSPALAPLPRRWAGSPKSVERLASHETRRLTLEERESVVDALPLCGPKEACRLLDVNAACKRALSLGWQWALIVWADQAVPLESCGPAQVAARAPLLVEAAAALEPNWWSSFFNSPTHPLFPICRTPFPPYVRDSFSFFVV